MHFLSYEEMHSGTNCGKDQILRVDNFLGKVLRDKKFEAWGNAWTFQTPNAMSYCYNSWAPNESNCETQESTLGWTTHIHGPGQFSLGT